jgi:hypothetical protein
MVKNRINGLMAEEKRGITSYELYELYGAA